MISMEFNHKKFMKELEQEGVRSIKDEVRKAARSIIDPETGRHPTVTFTGNTLKNLQIIFNGSEEAKKRFEAKLT